MSDSLKDVVKKLEDLEKRLQDMIDESRRTNKCVMCNRKIYYVNIPLKDFLELNKKYIINEIELYEYDNSVVITERCSRR
jgi:NAD kinase